MSTYAADDVDAIRAGMERLRAEREAVARGACPGIEWFGVDIGREPSEVRWVVLDMSDWARAS